MENKRGDIQSIIYITMFLVIVGIVIFLISHTNIELFTELQDVLNNSDYNSTEAYTQATNFKDVNQSRLWDYAFLGLFFGSLIAIGLSSYAVRISPIFYWVYAVLSLVVLTLGTILSNLWQSISSDPEFATTITYFPIMNTLLGSYYPIIVTAIVIIAMMVLFGKPPGQQEGFI